MLSAARWATGSSGMAGWAALTRSGSSPYQDQFSLPPRNWSVAAIMYNNDQQVSRGRRRSQEGDEHADGRQRYGGEAHANQLVLPHRGSARPGQFGQESVD